MIVRKIREEEYARTQELFSIAFEIPMAAGRVSPQELARIKAEPRTREERYWLERWAAFDDSGQMMSFLIGWPALVRFDGGVTVCTCIGGVSSLPQFRGKGAIAQCFRRHLEDSYQTGAVFSYLYPFSTSFYRQFGYELCAESVEWTLEIDRLAGMSAQTGEAVLNEGDSQQAAIEEVYRRYMEDYNLSFVREGWDWSRDVARNPAVEGRFTYVWRNQAGIPKGAFTFRKEYEPGLDRATMLCDAFYFDGEEGLRGLLTHLYSYRGHFQKVRLTVPKDAALERVAPEVSGGCRRELRFVGMGRVIHAEKALQLAAYRGSGTVSLKLIDPCVEENNDVFRVTFQEGRCVKIQRGGQWDAELPINKFSRLLLGNCDWGEVQAAPLNQVFYRKKLFLCDGF